MPSIHDWQSCSHIATTIGELNFLQRLSMLLSPKAEPWEVREPSADRVASKRGLA